MRRIVVLVGTGLAMSVCAVAPASAATALVAPITGTMSCGLDGTVKFTGPLPNGNSDGAARNVHVKITAKISDCNTRGVAGGKLPITGGTLTVNGILEAGASCADIADGTPPDFTFDKNVFNAKWTGTGAKPAQHPTVGKSHTNVAATGDYLLGTWEYLTDLFADNDAFGGQSATLDLVVDNPSAVVKCARGDLDANGKPLTLRQVTFSAAHGSQISVTR